MTDAPFAVAPPAPLTPKRPVWPWIVGGLGVLLVLGAGIAVAIVLLTAGQKEADAEAVEQVVLDFDSAYEEGDCDLFEELTTEDVRDYLFEDGGYDCDAFEEVAEGLFDENGDYTYEVDIESVTVDGDEAEVETTETWEYDGDSYESEVTYRLERENGRWIVSDYDDDIAEVSDAEESDEEVDTAGPNEDNEYKADLANAKVALISYAVANGGDFIANFEDLEEYGLELGPRLDYMTLQSTATGFCFETTSQLTGITYSISESTSVDEISCSELDF